MSQTPIYEEVRQALGRPERARERRAFRGDTREDADGHSSRPVMLRGTGGRHRRSGD